jgi:hypothetical protein
MIHLYRIIFFSLLVCNTLLSTSPVIPKTHHHPTKEISAKQHKKLLRSLYEEEIVFSTLDPETVLLYIQILKENKVILKHTIAHQTGFFNNFDILIGIIGVWFGAQWLISNGSTMAVLLFYLAHPGYESKSASISTNQGLFGLATSCMLTALSACILKMSSVSLSRGWHKKENALKDLAKTEELLIQLEKCKNHPDNRLAIALF